MRVSHLLLAALSLVACNNNTEEAVMQDNLAPVTDSLSQQEVKEEKLPSPAKDSIPANIQVDTVIHLAVTDSSNEISAKGTLNKNADPVICYLPISKKKKIIASLTPDNAQLNIRFSQIIMPDNKSDGPFSRQLNYKLSEPGIYKLIIAPNTMAEGKRSGDFLLKIQLKDY